MNNSKFDELKEYLNEVETGRIEEIEDVSKVSNLLEECWDEIEVTDKEPVWKEKPDGLISDVIWNEISLEFVVEYHDPVAFDWVQVILEFWTLNVYSKIALWERRSFFCQVNGMGYNFMSTPAYGKVRNMLIEDMEDKLVDY